MSTWHHLSSGCVYTLCLPPFFWEVRASAALTVGMRPSEWSPERSMKYSFPNAGGVLRFGICVFGPPLKDKTTVWTSHKTNPQHTHTAPDVLCHPWHDACRVTSCQVMDYTTKTPGTNEFKQNHRTTRRTQWVTWLVWRSSPDVSWDQAE